MAHRELRTDRSHDSHADSEQGLSMLLIEREIDRSSRQNSIEVPSIGDIEGESAQLRDLYLKVFLIQKGRHVLQFDLFYAPILDGCLGCDTSCGSIKNDAGQGFNGRDQPCFDSNRACSYRTMSTHVEIAININKDNTQVGPLFTRRKQDSAVHHLMAAR